MKALRVLSIISQLQKYKLSIKSLSQGNFAVKSDPQRYDNSKLIFHIMSNNINVFSHTLGNSYLIKLWKTCLMRFFKGIE